MDELLNIAKLNKLDPSKGKVLISEPFMDDEYFKRSVVFLCEHTEEGTFGFVVNNPLSVNLNEVVENVKSEGFVVSFGGPVNSSNLYYLHTIDNLDGSHEVIPGLYTGGKFDDLVQLINTGIVHEDQVKFFLGYAGWDAGQLVSEVADSAWIVSDINVEDIMTIHHDHLWQELLQRMGGKFKMISNFPEDPTLN